MDTYHIYSQKETSNSKVEINQLEEEVTELQLKIKQLKQLKSDNIKLTDKIHQLRKSSEVIVYCILTNYQL